MDNLPPLWAEWQTDHVLFCDWITLGWEQPDHPDFVGDRWTCDDMETGQTKRQIHKGRRVGSARSTIAVSVVSGRVRLDGNPNRVGVFTYGAHWLPGCASIHGVSMGIVVAANALHPNLNLRLPGFPDIRFREIDCTRVDLTKHIPVPVMSSNMLEDTMSALRFLGLSASHRGKAATASTGSRSVGTVYLKGSSKRWSLKAYCKGLELLDHGEIFRRREDDEREDDDEDLANSPFIWGAVRIELTLRAPELAKIGATLGFRASDPARPRSIFELDGEQLDEVWRAYWGKITMPKCTIAARDELLTALPRHLRGIYARWKAGEDLTLSASRMTLWRWRKALMAYGVNIDQPPVKDDAADNPASILPTWAARIGELRGGAYFRSATTPIPSFTPHV